MKFTLRVRMYNTEGALERVLGRLRQRGFAVCSLSADSSADRTFMTVRITMESDRAVESALKQIGKLYDVMDLQIVESETNNGYGNQHFEQASRVEVCLSV